MPQQKATKLNLSDIGAQRGTWPILAAIFVVAVAFNYVWELAQTPLYLGMNDFSRMLWHCFVASLGDGLLVLLIFAAGRAVLRQWEWFVRPGIRGYALMLGAGLVIAVVIEMVAVRILVRWEYATGMPIMPFLGVGLAPVLQMLVLPPLIFRVVAVWCKSPR